MNNVSRIDPALPVLAQTIASGLMSDLTAGRISSIGRDEISASIDARDINLTDTEREKMIGMVCRRLVIGLG